MTTNEAVAAPAIDITKRFERRWLIRIGYATAALFAVAGAYCLLFLAFLLG